MYNVYILIQLHVSTCCPTYKYLFLKLNKTFNSVFMDQDALFMGNIFMFADCFLWRPCHHNGNKVGPISRFVLGVFLDQNHGGMKPRGHILEVLIKAKAWRF